MRIGYINSQHICLAHNSLQFARFITFSVNHIAHCLSHVYTVHET